MPKSRLLEGVDAKTRAKQRQCLGTLRELTVQPATRRRYDLATQAFFKYLTSAGLSLPTRKTKLDPLVCDYLEYLWSTAQAVLKPVTPWQDSRIVNPASVTIFRDRGVF